jgi:hypothetical protein
LGRALGDARKLEQVTVRVAGLREFAKRGGQQRGRVKPHIRRLRRRRQHHGDADVLENQLFHQLLWERRS